VVKRTVNFVPTVFCVKQFRKFLIQHFVKFIIVFKIKKLNAISYFFTRSITLLKTILPSTPYRQKFFQRLPSEIRVKLRVRRRHQRYILQEYLEYTFSHLMKLRSPNPLCAALGIRKIHCPPYSPEGKGKIERFFVFKNANYFIPTSSKFFSPIILQRCTLNLPSVPTGIAAMSSARNSAIRILYPGL
jgi:hypothetical protein